MRRLGRLVLVMLAVTACERDAGEEAFVRARAKHLALLEGGREAEDKGFDEVLAGFAQVPKGSRRYDEAQRLVQAITMARHHVRAPLAVVRRAEEGLPPALQAQSEACVRMAEASGRDGGATPEAVKALDACRKQLETMVRAMIHAQAPDHHDDDGEHDAGH
jgi:hypothetical protein